MNSARQTARHQALTAGIELTNGRYVLMPDRFRLRFSGVNFPNLRCTITSAAYKPLAIGAESNGVDRCV